MAVYAAGHNRAAIWDAMMARKTNALTSDNIHLLTAIEDAIQGGIVAPGNDARLRIEAVAGGFIDAIDVVRNGRLAYRISPDVTPNPISNEFETILYLELGWRARGCSHRWDCSIGVDGGEIIAAEPRFRVRTQSHRWKATTLAMQCRP